MTDKKTGRPANPKSIRQLALAAGLPYPTVRQRISKMKWTLEKALSTPVKHRVIVVNPCPQSEDIADPVKE